MSKDPAFLLYSSDFLTGTMFFSMEEKGEYITLLCIQHQHGHIAEKDFFSVCKPNSKVVSKFSVDEKGFYFNSVLEEVVTKRKEFSLSRRNNRLGKKKTSVTSVKHMNKTDIGSLKHMENEIENENEDLNKSKNTKSVNKIIDYLNQILQTHYKYSTEATCVLIMARLKEGFTVDNFKTVIFKKHQEWAGTEYEKHLTPSTLFRSSNFEKYLNQTGNFNTAKNVKELEEEENNEKLLNLMQAQRGHMEPEPNKLT